MLDIQAPQPAEIKPQRKKRTQQHRESPNISLKHCYIESSSIYSDIMSLQLKTKNLPQKGTIGISLPNLGGELVLSAHRRQTTHKISYLKCPPNTHTNTFHNTGNILPSIVPGLAPSNHFTYHSQICPSQNTS